MVFQSFMHYPYLRQRPLPASSETLSDLCLWCGASPICDDGRGIHSSHKVPIQRVQLQDNTPILHAGGRDGRRNEVREARREGGGVCGGREGGVGRKEIEYEESIQWWRKTREISGHHKSKNHRNRITDVHDCNICIDRFCLQLAPCPPATVQLGCHTTSNPQDTRCRLLSVPPSFFPCTPSLGHCADETMPLFYYIHTL